jgi:hypothetical protein
MDQFLCHLGRTFPLAKIDERAGKSVTPKSAEALSASDINLNPVFDPKELKYLGGLSQFRYIPNGLLFKLVLIKTGLRVSDRWRAIQIIVDQRIPIPVLKPLADVRHDSDAAV